MEVQRLFDFLNEELLGIHHFFHFPEFLHQFFYFLFLAFYFLVHEHQLFFGDLKPQILSSQSLQQNRHFYSFLWLLIQHQLPLKFL